jgi:hypothetical protein
MNGYYVLHRAARESVARADARGSEREARLGAVGRSVLRPTMKVCGATPVFIRFLTSTSMGWR